MYTCCLNVLKSPCSPNSLQSGDCFSVIIVCNCLIPVSEIFLLLSFRYTFACSFSFHLWAPELSPWINCFLISFYDMYLSYALNSFYMLIISMFTFQTLIGLLRFRFTCDFLSCYLLLNVHSIATSNLTYTIVLAFTFLLKPSFTKPSLSKPKLRATSFPPFYRKPRA